MDTFERIRELLAEQLDIDEEKITMDSNILEDFEADSLDVVDMVMSLEDEFGVEIPTRRSRICTPWAMWFATWKTTPDPPNHIMLPPRQAGRPAGGLIFARGLRGDE